MTLREKQSVFLYHLAALIVWSNQAIAEQAPDGEIYGLVEFTLGDGLRKDRKGHMANSLHYIGLAQDLNLFIDGKYIKKGDHPVWREIGEYWEKRHPLARWGGRFKSVDSNHFSFEHEGRA